jgi:Peptidase M61 N-terminal domain
MNKQRETIWKLAFVILILALAAPAASHPSNKVSRPLARANAQRTKPPLTIALSVDATDAQRKILHARLTVPAASGPLTLVYPAWIPGEHAPTGPIINLTGLTLTAGGKSIPWQRDLVDMFAFHCEVPQGASAVEV